MPMKNPSHPGTLIKSDIDALGLSIVEAAKGLGISRQQLHSVIAGRASVTPEMAIRLEKALGSTADTWLRLQMNYDLGADQATCTRDRREAHDAGWRSEVALPFPPHSASTVTTPDTALMAPAIWGETLKRPGSFTSTSLPSDSIRTIETSPSP